MIAHIGTPIFSSMFCAAILLRVTALLCQGLVDLPDQLFRQRDCRLRPLSELLASAIYRAEQRPEGRGSARLQVRELALRPRRRCLLVMTSQAVHGHERAQLRSVDRRLFRRSVFDTATWSRASAGLPALLPASMRRCACLLCRSLCLWGMVWLRLSDARRGFVVALLLYNSRKKQGAEPNPTGSPARLRIRDEIT